MNPLSLDTATFSTLIDRVNTIRSAQASESMALTVLYQRNDDLETRLGEVETKVSNLLSDISERYTDTEHVALENFKAFGLSDPCCGDCEVCPVETPSPCECSAAYEDGCGPFGWLPCDEDELVEAVMLTLSEPLPKSVIVERLADLGLTVQ